MQFTEEQRRAIEARGTNLLLSAAAGSGKTAVLVQRVLSLIEEGADVRRMLVVTFTRAAAAEMRERLAARLGEAAAEGDARLREQMLCLDRASISTLHGFCAEFLRANFEAAGVDPAFRILDDAEDARLLDEAADEAMDALYEEGGEALARLDAGRGPDKVRDLALRLYAFLGERPDPKAWLERALDPGQAPVQAWTDELLRAARRALDAALAMTRAAHDHPGCPPHYAAALEKDLDALLELRGLEEAEALSARLRAFKQARPAGRNRDVDPEDLEAVKALRKAAGDYVKRCRLSELSLAQAREDALKLYGVFPALAEAARRIGEAHARRKEERGGLSYADLERCALRALTREDVRNSVRGQFDYVFVDEYQDVSDLQEALIAAVSRGDDLFAVGDVKQSIYRFRLAEPRLFLGRYERYMRGEGGRLLPLTRNFRSTRPVIDFVNAVFSRTMTGGDSEIVYDDLARLNAGLEGTDDAPIPEIHILDEAADAGGEIDEPLEEIGRAGREAKWIAGRIRHLMAEEPGLRYRDIAILTRAKSSAAAAMLPVLLSEGIPAYAEGLSGYFDTLEVAFALSLLRLVDNELEDVEMIGALRSCMAGLTLEELSQIRLAHPDASFADAARACAGEGEGALTEKLRAFFALLDSWQLRAGALPLGELVRAVCVESGFYTYAGALPGGAQRQANLDALVTRAGNFDATVSGSLTRFLAYAEHMRARGDGDSAHLLGEGDDVVRLMTIHKSKGLEFPVVFGALTARSFRGAGGGESFRAHRELGLGMHYVDETLRTRREPLSYIAIGERERREDAAEELRLLYVLLTRAKRRLFLVGSLRSADARLPLYAAMGACPGAATSHLQWMLGALEEEKRAGEAPSARVVVHGFDELAAPAAQQPRPEAVDALDAALGQAGEQDAAMAWVYPHLLDSERPVKLTASGLLREAEGPRELPTLAERPQFMQEAGMTGAERGSAYHRALQLLELAPLRALDGASLTNAVRAQLDDLRMANRLSETERKAVSPQRLARFFAGGTGRRLLRSETVRREWPFNVRMKVEEAFGDAAHARYGGGEVLVQGTVDCCFLEDGGWVLLDYKTDITRDREALVRHYEQQLAIYALALARITGLPVREKCLCLLASGEEIVL